MSVTILEDRLAPAILTVNSLADGPVSAASSALTLREAVVLIDTGGTATDASGNSLAAAKASQVNTASPFGSNDIIQFAPNLFGAAQQQIVLEDGSLLLDRNVSINGPAASWLAVSGNNQSTVFEVAPWATVSISGLTIEGGAASGNSGGGIVNTGTLTLLDSAVSGNTALNDGGIFTSGTLTLIDSTVSGNTAVLGNGGLANYGGALTLVDSSVSGNSAVGAGGLGNYDSGTATLLNSTVSGNSADFAGGILNTATLTLTDSTVAGNTAVQGGGGVFNTATLTLLNSAVWGNTASSDGGIFNSGTLTLTESTVSGNTAVVGNGGLANDGALTLIDSSVSGNTAGGSATRVVSGDSRRMEDRSSETEAQTLAAGIRLANLADGSANNGVLSPNDGAVSGGVAGASNGRLADDGDTLTPIDNAQSGRSADDSISSDSTGKGSSGAETSEAGDGRQDVNSSALTLAQGAISSYFAGDAREGRAKHSGEGRETISMRSWVQPAWELAPAASSKSNTEGAERFVLRDREGVLDQEPASQVEWKTFHLAGLLLLSGLPNGGWLLEEPSAERQQLPERNKDCLRQRKVD